MAECQVHAQAQEAKALRPGEVAQVRVSSDQVATGHSVALAVNWVRPVAADQCSDYGSYEIPLLY